jgi:hypothetical protein
LQGNGADVSVPQVLITTLSGTRLLLSSATCCSVIPRCKASEIEPFGGRADVLLSHAAKAARQSAANAALIVFLPVKPHPHRRE